MLAVLLNRRLNIHFTFFCCHLPNDDDSIHLLSIASQTSGDEAWVLARHAEHYETVRPLLNKVFCVPASPAPVERVFSYGGIIARPHRAKLSDN